MGHCVSKHRIYFALLLSFMLYLTLYFVNFSVVEEHHFEPLFAINITNNVVIFRGSNNISKSYKWNEKLDESEDNDVYKPLCPEVPPKLEGRIKLITEPTATFENLQKEFVNSSLQMDGRYRPPQCNPLHKLAIIVPYRDRFVHLNIFLRNIHRLLQKQLLDYTIFIIEQAGSSPFNRGMLMNVGFMEAMKRRRYDCFIFHDVDLLPEDDRNIYSCPDQPRHMSVAVNVFDYKLPYIDIFGGVGAMSTAHFQLVNGFSNTFWGWGGEDDDMSMRIRMKGLHLSRYPYNIARYTMMPHVKQKANPYRYEKLHYGRQRFNNEGLNSLEYQRLSIQYFRLFTWVFVKLSAPSQNNFWHSLRDWMHSSS